MTPSVLIACIGNIFLGDDGFGTEVARALAGRTFPQGVAVRDFGIRGIDLTYALLEPHDLIILVDACARGGNPGTIYVIEPEEGDVSTAGQVALETHAMNPVAVLRAARGMGGARGRILIVGCEPADLGSEEGKLGLSESVEAAIPDAVSVIESLALRALNGENVVAGIGA